MFPATARRVPAHTSERVNRRIRWRMEESVAYYAAHPELIDRRLQELDEEWDIERALEANAASVALASLFLGTLVHRRWYALTGLVGGFLLQHALQGWCPPLPALRRMGLRTETEIDEERMALRAVRGDFRDAQNHSGNEHRRTRALLGRAHHQGESTRRGRSARHKMAE
jgi:hypothetical protein